MLKLLGKCERILFDDAWKMIKFKLLEPILTWGRDRAYLPMNCLRRFAVRGQSWVACNRDRMASKASNISYLALYRTRLLVKRIGFRIKSSETWTPDLLLAIRENVGKLWDLSVRCGGRMMKIWWLRTAHNFVPRKIGINCTRRKSETKNHPFWNW